MGRERLPELQQSPRGCGFLTLHPVAGSAPCGARLLLHHNTHGETARTTILGIWPQTVHSFLPGPLGQPWHPAHIQDRLLPQVLSAPQTMGPGAGMLLYFTLGFLLMLQGTTGLVVASDELPQVTFLAFSSALHVPLYTQANSVLASS